MRQESNHRMSNGERDSVKISNSRAMGVIVLIALLFLFQVVTFVVQKVRMRQVAAVAEAGAGGGAGISGVGPTVAVGSKTFPFNPNTITEDSLQMLGFSQRQAASIIKYRTKGGKFRVKRDFAKMYVVDSVKYAALEPFILLPDRLPGKRNVTHKPKNVTTAHQTHSRQAPAPQPAPASKYGTRLPKEKYVCNLNTADSAALVQLYGIGGYYARKILRYREVLGGSFVDARQLLEIEGFTQERFARIEKNVFVSEEDVKGFSILNAERRAL